MRGFLKGMGLFENGIGLLGRERWVEQRLQGSNNYNNVNEEWRRMNARCRK